jgi:hypothetical protein
VEDTKDTKGERIKGSKRREITRVSEAGKCAKEWLGVEGHE